MQDRYRLITEPSHDRETRAHRFLRQALPDRSPYAAWGNFEFVTLDGAAFDVDALVLTPAGVFLIEFVSHRGALELAGRTWVHTHQNGARQPFDNPWRLADRKAKLLRTLLAEVMNEAKPPHIEAVVWITEPEVDLRAQDRGGDHVVVHPDREGPSIVDVIATGSGPAVRRSPWELDTKVLHRLETGLREIGIGRSGRNRRYGDWNLVDILAANPRHQDWIAKHVKKDEVRRARIFSTPRDLPDDALARLQEAARREFEILESLRHPNILAVDQHIRSERRPGLLFECPANGVRLDHWLDANDVTVLQKLDFITQVAEAVRFAHRKSVVHRAISPQSVLVVEDASSRALSLKVLNWHTSRREEFETGTVHIHDYVDDVEQAYLAPELSNNPNAGDEADVYGIGALAFRLFAGAPPAASLAELVDVLISARGLRPSRIADGVPEEIDDLIFDATRSVASDRVPSVTALLDRLANIRARFERSGKLRVDPLEAQPGDVLDDRFEVVRRIGVGSTATALLVKHEMRDAVLKVANTEANAGRLRAEGKVLESLDHKLIVDLYDSAVLGGRYTLVLQNAGTSLRSRLRDGALSLDELRRFGEDLCDILVELEDNGVLHRDIKPANLGIGQPSGSAQRLMLFDFSLADVPLDSWDVGTPTYRDPFIRASNRRRWDEYGDRYSAALTLYEMVTGRLPVWGDGRTEPIFDEAAECRTDAHLFPASVREPLEEFFQRSFQRDYRERFDNAHDMRQAWRRAFEETTQTRHDSIDRVLVEATRETSVASLGLSPVALDALDRLDVVTIGDLLALKPQDIQFQKGVANAVRTELGEIRAQLLDQFPVGGGLHEASEGEYGELDRSKFSVDQVLARLNGELSRHGREYCDFVTALLGQKSLQQALPWASLDALASRTDRGQAQFHEEFDKLRSEWRKKGVLAPLRDDIVHLIENNAGAMSDAELAKRVLGLRGSILDDSNERMAAASAVARAAVEAELASDDSRLMLVRVWSNAVFVVTREEMADALQPLGHCADRLVKESGVVTAGRAQDAFESVLSEMQIPQIPHLRLLSLAVEASQGAALSSRNELYARGLPALEALKLSAGIFVATEELAPEDVKARVAARYPAAEALPGHPQLGGLLREVGLSFVWDTSRRDGDGAYVNRAVEARRLRRETLAPTYSTGTSLPTTQQFGLRRQFEERLAYKLKYGGFLVLTVDPRESQKASDWLVGNYEFEALSLDELFVQTLRQKATDNDIDWTVILDADASRGEDWSNLMHLMRFQVLPAVRDALTAHRGALLLTNPGLLARYDDADSMSLLAELYDRAGTENGPRMVGLLVPSDQRHSAPSIDGKTIPVLHGSEYVRVPHTVLPTA